jgi:ArsR family metal-binding transcriptional regulator
MLVKHYQKEFCRPPNPEAQHLRCVAHLDADISEVLPYLNTVLRGHQYFRDVPSLTLKFPGKLVTLYPDRIAMNIVQDQAEAESLLAWLVERINETWERRSEIKTTFEITPKPRILDILRLLPKTNRGQCDHPTCMALAVKIAEGSSPLEACSELDENKRKELWDQLAQFRIPI